MISVQKRCDSSRSRTLSTRWLTPRGVCALAMGPSCTSEYKPGRSAAAAQLRIPGVAERVAEEIEREHGQADRQPRKDGEPGRLLHEGAARAAQHQPPGRCRRLRADAEERQCGFDEDRVAQPDRGDD